MVLSMSANIARRQLASPMRWRSNADNLRPFRFLHATSAAQLPRKRNFFSSNAMLQQEDSKPSSEIAETVPQIQKRKTIRSPPGKRSLRRVAVEAQRSREDNQRRQDRETEGIDSGNLVTAICVAEEFDMSAVVRILRSHGFPIDPDGTGFLDEQVVHTRVNEGDVFVFPSGTVVAWSLPEDVAVTLATQTLKPAALNPYVENLVEVEDLEYKEDPTREISNIKGDVITLGTKTESQETNESRAKVDTTLAKIAFSSGLARSTKLAVLESMLSAYISSTRTIPQVLSAGSRLPFSRTLILQKTGQLLELRAQLNHYSELTDSLPDLFWDSRHDLGLEGYYDQVGKALDVGIRIKTLNEKMDYAQEIASILRDTLSHKHSAYLEWIIIVLIAVEIGFELKRDWKERVAEWARKAAEKEREEEQLKNASA